MLEDAGIELTSHAGAGQTVTADAYGGNPCSLGVAGVDPAVGEPLQAFYQVMQDFATLTSLTINVIHDDDGAGTNKATLLTTGAVLQASLVTTGGVHRIGAIAPGAITKKYLAVFLDVGGSSATAGKVRVWLQKGSDVIPVNPGAL
jgi:hypothetical protein